MLRILAIQLERQIPQAAAPAYGLLHERGHDAVSFAERHPAPGQVIRQVRGKHGVVHAFAYPALSYFQGLPDRREDRQCDGHRVDRIEERFLFILHVLVVRVGQTLEHGDERDQAACDAAALAPQQFGGIRILLLRHDAAARGQPGMLPDVPEFRGRPDDQVLARPADTDHQRRAGGEELDVEIAVAHCVDAVGRQPVETELIGQKRAVDGKGAARHRPGAEGHDVDPLPAVRQTLPVPLEPEEERKGVVGEPDRLRLLQVGIPGEDDVHGTFGQAQQRFLAFPNPPGDVVHHLAEIQPLVRGVLVVAAPARVQLSAHGTHFLDQAFLHGHVDVFQVPGQRVGAAFDLAFDLAQCHFDHPALIAGEHADAHQPAGIGDAAPDVHAKQAAVRVDGRVEIIHESFECYVPAVGHDAPILLTAALSFTAALPFIARPVPRR